MSEQADSLRRALAAASGTDALSQLTRHSLANIASRTEEGRAVLQQAVVRASELDIHLDGAGVRDHETQAFTFGRFVTRSSNAVKEIAKGLSGRKALPSRLQVLAPAMGSVRVVLKAPEPIKRPGTFPDSEVDELEDTALRHLVALLLQAEDALLEDTPLDAALHGLRGEARNAVRLLGQTVLDGHWSLEGEFRPRVGVATPVVLSPAGAQRLVTAARLQNSEVTTTIMSGLVDGWTWSTQVLAFEPDQGRSIRASVPEPLQRDVAALLTDLRSRCTASFTVITRFAPGDAEGRNRSFALESIEAMADEPTLLD